ncbi:hypothetical protein LWC35_10725 [Pseudonocardia kujensis]|uniref:hypothetical protein n=1 Tax=Pseudonocardia kujensis TaxID=1128675 RepID=UPI001E5BBF3E|nr:hypothetical protein [Pseudonocardia kujensis]MCE0763375.1 hypothetical protein [Pseudonocardia kujensis]
MSPDDSSKSPPTSNNHRLELGDIELVGGRRTVQFRPGLNVIQGDITTGKTTLVRLVRALLGTMPSGMPPEVDELLAIRGNVTVGNREWQIYRPRTTSRDALVEVGEVVSEQREPVALRLPVAAASRTYSLFLLDQLSIPAVSVPRARTEPAGALTPVTMSDWLSYCIITGDELDTQIFGHQNDWRNAKRRWVFEIAYGYYDPDLAKLNADLRSIELQLAAIEQSVNAASSFLANTPFADKEDLEQQLVIAVQAAENIQSIRREVQAESSRIAGTADAQQRLLELRRDQALTNESLARNRSQISDLRDLEKQLATQSSRLTRAIVADEWLVDFDFVVCPRCGSNVDAGRVDSSHCYLCLQEPSPTTSREQMLNEQARIASQIAETQEIVAMRSSTIIELETRAEELGSEIERISTYLDELTRTFVSDRANRLQEVAAAQAQAESEILRLNEYLELLQRYENTMRSRDQLEADRADRERQIHAHRLQHSEADANVRALESRMLQYLTELHIPNLSDELSVRINPTTFMPEVSGRTFDELSSQGLKTLVNVAHATAHHTVAIDRNLPMPGLLILDGLSSNAGHEGFDQARVRDVYRLLRRVSEQYEGRLQVVAVDNELDRSILLEFADRVVLTLSQEDRLIRMPNTSTP